ncbi:claspin-like [Anoplophora glabripennis]|uniref:claspin-like n=1 Tax=Anoplophora glabripennis TaxID=217634 RepID=UPI0008738C4E|nr:claspin-like [Anoplophora glabripennis]
MSSETETDSLGIESTMQNNDLVEIDNVNEQSKNDTILCNEENNFVLDNDNFYKVKRKTCKIIDGSDSEHELNSTTENGKNNQENLENRHRTLAAIVDSDSEEEMGPVIAHNKSFSDDALDTIEQPVFITNAEGKLIPEKVDINKNMSQAMRLSALCDSDSSEDEASVENKLDENNCLGETNVISKQYKKKQKPKENVARKPKKMTGKEAAQLRKEIKSESQRMLREKKISLPYHKPKSYTIKEFLSKRSKFSSAVPINVKAPPSVAIKMSAEQLTLVSEKLKEREKEVERFYKSESESEDDCEHKDYVPPSEVESSNQEDNKEVNEVTEHSAALPVENKDEEPQLQLAVSENTSNAVENATVVSNVFENRVTEEGQMDVSANNANFKDCDILDNMTIDNSSDVVDQNNTDLTVIDNPNKEVSIHKDLGSGDKPVEDLEINNAPSETLRTDEGKEQCSMDYEFSLDGLDQNSETIHETENPAEKRSTFEYTDLVREIENFGSDDNQLSTAPIEQPKNLSKLELIKESLVNINPKLTGSPNDVIDLETGVAKPNEVTKLMKRFVEHNFKKAVPKNNVELSIISFESGEIHKETVAMKLEDESDLTAVEEKPGAKLQKLRIELQDQMAQKRSEWWKKKTTEQSNNEKTNTDEGENEDCGPDDDDILDDEEEEMDITESSEEEEEEVEENDHVDREEKKKSIFIDEEAEESDEDGEIIEATSEDEVANQADDENEIDDASDCNENEEESEASNEKRCANKTYKKILKGFSEDSDEEELVSKSEDLKKNEGANSVTTQEDDDIFPPHQPQTSQTPIRQITQKKSDFEFLTPLSYITGLQNFNSASKNLKDSPVTSVFQNINEPSPLKEKNWQQSLQKKLFIDTEMTDSQAEGLYCEQFPEMQEAEESILTHKEQPVDSRVEEFPSTLNAKENEERLVDLCSGKFPSTAELVENRLGDQTPSTQDLLNICSGEFTGITQNGSSEKQDNVTETPADMYSFNTNKEVKSLDEDQDLIISQLIDEEEMEKFKKKFESPLISNTQRRIVEEFEEALTGGGVIDSDDDTDTVGVKKKNKKRIMFSDDEDSEDENDEEVIDLQDEIDDDEDSNIAPDNVAYDSEENEIGVLDDDYGTNMKKLKPSDFFENEAELSESEWDSADEDEKDLDTMEFEQGDDEKFDEKQIRTDLEKIHMRRMLDDDTREVKLLQEMLLEDGELHGTGRERQFKWKNIDSVIESNETRKEEDDVYLEEEESEEQWRKRRHEREMFLKKKLINSQDLDDDNLLSDSQLLKIGQKVLQRSQSNSQNSTPIDKNNIVSESPVLKQSFTLLSKRGSFLSRNDQVLQRLAEYNKVTSVTLGTATAKNSRNFLFQTVTVEETSVVSKDKKRKATDGTPSVIKKLRLTSNLSPAVKRKPSTKTKLFGNW